MNLQSISDKFAISLSVLCTLHCLLIPSVVILLPSLTALHLEDEIFHIWMVFAVIPVSGYALTMGCKQHKNFRVMIIGVIGLVLLVLSAMLGHDILSESLEKLLTVAGALVLVAAHLWNYSLCRESSSECGCT